MSRYTSSIESILALETGKKPGQATTAELYNAVSKAAVEAADPAWKEEKPGKRACYFSAEFLIGRMIYSNLLNLGLLRETADWLKEKGTDITVFEDIEDAALGNGGLGRLAACFLDSAATQGVALDGYGIRYRYGLFKQTFEDGFQRETADDWQRFGDPWSVRRETEKVQVRFGDQTVWAVPYDMPVIGYGGKTVNTLRLWQAEPLQPFDFTLFNEQKYDEAYREKNEAEAISSVLYPNDDTEAGKRLRLKQQYFFSSASIRSILKAYKRTHGSDFSHLPEEYAIQLNDTHPTVSIAELLRILAGEEALPFEKAFSIAERVFAYTNHTIMAEALEKWDARLFMSVLPDVYPYIVMVNDRLRRDLLARGIEGAAQEPYRILSGGLVHMARLAIYAGHSINGVAGIHTEILKNTALREWYALWPERFNNKTNGITQRRWLALANPELAAFITEKVGDGWLTDLSKLKGLEAYQDDSAVLDAFAAVKLEKKQQLAAHIQKAEGVSLDPSFLFDIQVKRLHEYKRQMLNALSILDLYFGMKDGRIRDFYPTAFIFGAKAAPSYFRAKAVIKFINEIARLVDGDSAVRDRLKVVFVQNYNVSYAEKLTPAADVSEQISTAGTEASGTGNMKFMLNGAVTLGTYDGANVEIVGQAGEENNYIFGARVEEIAALETSYDPKAIYRSDARIKRLLDTLLDGTLDDGKTGMFEELFASLTEKTWNRADQYYVLHDFHAYMDTKLRVNRDYAQNRAAFTKKCFLNTANAGMFSSDRTILQYAQEIWGVPMV
ncbi:glycogen/starch/alpha-glucan phosphorylase [Ethanoligenens harbinense]|uniref:Alpha-1,4 glucan phosphorylase n=1 Tax=Ethanoligenens harbinense (strain DSM 18485 / JCM 12961 / CGMCC 1.5033 / YUAN-3) TaxID=663278 RepID=E6U712_ETHHY|nr:glycogen/starch/alpha-glucan phosphorylase [Ethanoligenens harbinense]ADU28082.1 glycogen/starch/alpha-glucan phosphorylase [Ethanoligenens harbinense YUAN-3]AVQ97094.1 glycogen/starch/alpha-glucan family phosphorylase [Ethanoligenens harbinense YUAN-3]AYF39756.1 glycogen/starch/alpha-glucan family phosphorylase [Ethanoligenens harbinense]AYF42589.1 glycogen/starch/alpha-glucan family phosphorylase [Ethanoligenens harbinense]QCN93337.1 glycogen/starch/alpha-glucan family phosphorylase [Etha